MAGTFVLFDRVSFMDGKGNSFTAARGEELPSSAPTEEVERLTALGALGSADDLAATTTSGRPTFAADAAAAQAAEDEARAAADAEAAAVAAAQASTEGASTVEETAVAVEESPAPTRRR